MLLQHIYRHCRISQVSLQLIQLVYLVSASCLICFTRLDYGVQSASIQLSEEKINKIIVTRCSVVLQKNFIYTTPSTDNECNK